MGGITHHVSDSEILEILDRVEKRIVPCMAYHSVVDANLLCHACLSNPADLFCHRLHVELCRRCHDAIIKKDNADAREGVPL